MNVLPFEKQTQIANCLVEGTSLRATARLCGVERNTVARVLLRIGDRCAWLLNEKLRRIHSRRVEVRNLDFRV
jgi:transposase-like protein